MDLREETSIEKLKAITLDELDKIAVSQQNVQMLRQRVAQLQELEVQQHEKKTQTGVASSAKPSKQ